MLRERLPLIVCALLVVLVTPTAAAAWTTSASVPASFRPNRSVTFSYTATSSSGLDLQVHWIVTLTTCKDTNADNACTAADAFLTDHGARLLNVNAGSSGTVTWSVSLAHPEGTYRYVMDAGCNPQFGGPTCTGNQPVAPGDDKTGTFQLAYTNTWARVILATSPVAAGSTQTVTYRMTSTSPDDRDLTGTAELFSTPPGTPEASQGPKPYTANANTQVTVQWPGVAFPNVGQHQLRTTDTTAPDTTHAVTVRGAHLHVLQPRETYPAGSLFGLYFTLEGHGSTPDPQAIASTEIRVTFKNGTFIVSNFTLRTDAGGTAYANVQTPHDAQRLDWTAASTGTWAGVTFDLTTTGNVTLTPGASAIEDDVAKLREDVEAVRFKGVHLDDLGSHNLFLAVVRGAAAVAFSVLLILLVVCIAVRV